jgi:hypothetical protein
MGGATLYPQPIEQHSEHAPHWGAGSAPLRGIRPAGLCHEGCCSIQATQGWPPHPAMSRKCRKLRVNHVLIHCGTGHPHGRCCDRGSTQMDPKITAVAHCSSALRHTTAHCGTVTHSRAQHKRRKNTHPSGRALSMTTGGAVGGLAGDLLGSLHSKSNPRQSQHAQARLSHTCAHPTSPPTQHSRST